MSKRLRLALLGCAGGLSLALAGSALAQFTPRLVVSHGTMGLNRASTNIIRLTVPRTDEALFKATIYAPRGYTYNLTQTPGTEVGTVTAQVQVREPIPGAVLPLNGRIVSDNPANHVSAPCAPGLHNAVWILVLQAAGQELRVPVYVDQATGGETAFASLKLQVCLPSPHIPQSQGGATFGAKLIQAQLNLNSVRAPTNAGTYTWRGIFTPWRAPATPNIAGTVEARANIAFPARLTLSLRVVNRNRRIVRWSGRLTEGGIGVAGARIEMLRGGQARGRAFAPLRVRVRKTTSANGSFSGTLRFKRRGVVLMQVRAIVPERNAARPCATPSPLGVRCVSETFAFYSVSSNTARLRLR